MACFTVSCIIICMKNNSRSSKIIAPCGTVNYSHLVEAITARASNDRYIVLSMVDESFTDMAINFYETNLRPNNIGNYLFIGIGIAACCILYRESLACFHYADDPSAGDASAFGTADFNRKVNIKSDLIWESLTANFTVLLCDVDVIILQNPFDEIRVRFHRYVRNSIKCILLFCLVLFCVISVVVIHWLTD